MDEAKRQRAMTDKGLEYATELKRKDRNKLIKTLEAVGNQLKTLLDEGTSCDMPTARDKYKQWMTNYEELLASHQNYMQLLTLSEQEVERLWFETKNSCYMKLKELTESWMLKHSADDRRSESGRLSRTSSKASSQLSAARLKEEQRKAELLARASALAQKQEIEEEKLRLKIKEEKFEIKTELEVSDAKVKVIEELEKSMLQDKLLEDELDFNAVDHEIETPVKNVDFKDASVLNPMSPAWTPRHSHTVPLATNHCTDMFISVNEQKKGDMFTTHTASTPFIGNNQFPVLPAVSAHVPNANFGLSAVSRELNKPKADIQKFDGNPLHYKQFLRQFNTRVCANTDIFEERLNYLLQFTLGEAHKIVLGYSHMGDENGYKAALRELESRYGDADVIAHAYVKKALNWPIIKADNPKSLDEFSIYLKECQYAIENIEAVGVLEYSENLKQLVKKLPFYLQDKWRNIVYDTKDRGQIVKFKQLVSFVHKEAKKVNDPIYGKEVMSDSKQVDKHPRDKRRGKSTLLGRAHANFTTSANETPSGVKVDIQSSSRVPKSSSSVSVCEFCNNSSHSLVDCRNIVSKPLKDRYMFLKSKGLCFGCLNSGHQKLSCRNRMTCTSCKRAHPQILHVDPQVIDKVNSDASVTSSATNTGAGDIVRQALPIVPVRIKHRNSDKYLTTYAFLDSGSNATFISDKVVRSLNLEGRHTKINLITMGQKNYQETCAISNLEISDLNGCNTIPLPTVFSQEALPVSKHDIVTFEDIQRWSHLIDVPLYRIESDVDILIGINVPQAMEPWEVIPCVDRSPFAVKTALGWVINGPLGIIDSNDQSSMSVKNNRISVENATLEHQLRNQFNFDFSERMIDDTLQPSREDKQFLNSVSNSLKLKNGHYVIGLPFKENNVVMPNNRKQADQRLLSLSKRMSGDDKFCDEYVKFMESVIAEGYARKVSSEDLNRNDGRVWYLPHHGIYHPRKNKLRVVFDCAARYKGTSLNDNLLQGPNLTSSLIGTLLRFRREEIAIMGDIDSMFYQVHVPVNDASFLRFLWWEGGDVKQPPTEYQMVVHLFGAKSSPSCANHALRQTAMDNKDKFDPEVVNTVLRNFYVDDCLKSVHSVDSGVSLVKDLQELLKQGGFHIAKWSSNNREVMNAIPILERASEYRDLDLNQDDLPMDHALGVQWCAESDSFCFRSDIKDQSLTRRGILSMVSSIYDPLGFLAPIILKPKIMLQNTSKIGLGWDDPIDEEIVHQWLSWTHELDQLSGFKVVRCVKPVRFGTIRNVQLHHFADASEVGYGTVSYLRLENSESKVHCSFLLGKSRVAPLKQVTIPRLELTAATVAVRTDKMLKSELDMQVDKTVFWTDSMSVLRYIWNTSARFQTFVANRLAVIHEGSEPTQWRYINTKLNPADLASRGMSVNDLLRNNNWISAPSFLSENETRWPEVPAEFCRSIPDDDLELKRGSIKVAMSKVSESNSSGEIITIDKLIESHSSWYKMKRHVAWILKVKRELLDRIRAKDTEITVCRKDNDKSEENERDHSIISANDMLNAERSIIIYVQNQCFSTEIDALTDSLSLPKSSKIKDLDPFIADGMLRVGGRLCNSSMPLESKHPIILPKYHYVSKLILHQIHRDLKHAGRNQMLAHLREKFWLINAPSAIRTVVRQCFICRRRRATVGQQKMANLPEDRVIPDEPPFTRVGVDYFGPFEIKQRRCRVKRYGVIFTCLVTRAVHIEIAHSLNTGSYINALRRFVARRGQVKVMRSDNGTNFVGAEKELKVSIDEWNVSSIQNSMLQKNIEWKFNPPSGSHHGGVWERLIRSIRKIIHSVAKEQILDDESMQTLMCEIEFILNDRPITMVSNDLSDPEALTPNHLLLMKRSPNLPPGVFDKSDIYCKRRWRQVQYMANLFWKRWVREYLPLLQQRQKWFNKTNNLSVGDVVMVVDSNVPRNSWPMGIVLETYPDRFGLVRQVKVKTSTNSLIRPIDKLCVLLEAD